MFFVKNGDEFKRSNVTVELNFEKCPALRTSEYLVGWVLMSCFHKSKYKLLNSSFANLIVSEKSNSA